MKIGKFALAAVLLAASFVFASASFAADPWGPPVGLKDEVTSQRWTGIYVGGNLGYQIGDVEVDGAIVSGPSANIDGLSTDGWKYGVRGGFDWRVSNSPFVIGAFAGYDWGESEFSLSASLPPAFSGDVLRASLEPTWHVGLRAGLLVSEGTLVYVGYAFSQADFDLGSDIPGAGQFCATTPGLKCSDTIDGHTFLGGVEMKLTDSISAGLEYNYTQYDSVTIYADQWSKLSVDPDVHSVQMRVNWRPSFNLF